MDQFKQNLDGIRRRVPDAREGLPEDLFLLISELTPMINVDLLIKNKQHQTLLTWRDDIFYGSGWHIPGGIIRFKEKIETRIQKVALTELGTQVTFNPVPIAITELMAENRNVRGHFISLLYTCELVMPLDPTNLANNRPQLGQWAWHNGCPDNLIAAHEKFRPFISNIKSVEQFDE